MDWAYFFDIDGTIVEIALTPDNVQVDKDLLASIRELHERTHGAVALVTGRSISDVDKFFPIAGMLVAGQHGAEWRDANGKVSTHRTNVEGLSLVRRELEMVARRHPELFPEFKGLSVALHYRANPRLGGYANRLMRSLQSRFVPEFTLLHGKCIVELKPSGRDKGAAIQELMAVRPFQGRLPVFLGDDKTDEFGFQVINEMGGHSIKIGMGRTSARWRLKDVTAVREWLRSGIAGK